MDFATTFLDNPDLFPARSGGALWGTEELAIDFAGGPYRFTGLSPGQLEVVRERFGDLVLGVDRVAFSAAEARVFRAAESDFRPIDVNGWSYTLDLAHTPEAVRVAGLRFMGRLEWRARPTAAIWTSVGEGREFQGVFENFFRLWTAYRLLEQGGILLHSAAVVVDGEAFLFFGPSGAGKSTVAGRALAAGRPVLSDDLNVLRARRGEPVVEQVPFAGDLGQTTIRGGPFAVRAALRLAKATVNQIRALSRGEAVASLLASAPYLNSDPYRSADLQETLGKLLAGLPTFRLTLTRDAGFEEIVGLVLASL